MEKFVFTVSEEEAGLPLKKVIKARYHFSSRLMTKIKYQDLLMLNGKKVPGYQTASVGDEVSVSIPDEISHFEPEDIPIDIIYEDDDLLVINKQPSLTCHPTKGHKNHTLANAVMKYMLDNKESYKIRFINRLDMDTSGVVLIGKNSFTQAELIKQMDKNLTVKKYYALVSGIIDSDRIKNLLLSPGITLAESQGFSQADSSTLPREHGAAPTSEESLVFSQTDSSNLFRSDVLGFNDGILIDLPIGNPNPGKINRRVITD